MEGEKRVFGPNGTSIAGKAFVQRESKEVGILQIPTSMVPHTYLIPTSASGCLHKTGTEENDVIVGPVASIVRLIAELLHRPAQREFLLMADLDVGILLLHL